MKKKIIFLFLLVGMVTFAEAQVIVQSTRTSTKHTALVPYRGYVEFDGIFSSKGRMGFNAITAHGIQINPRFWVGIGLGFAYVDEDRIIWDRGSWDWYAYGHRYIACSIVGGGNNFINFAETKINILQQPLYSWMPYVSAALGWSLSNESHLYNHIKVGATWYNNKRNIGLSGFVGMNILANRYYASNREKSPSIYCLYFNFGVAFEFGGTKAFERSK